MYTYNKDYSKQYYERNKEIILKRQKNYYERNKEKIKEYNYLYWTNNKKKIYERRKQKKQPNIKYNSILYNYEKYKIPINNIINLNTTINFN